MTPEEYQQERDRILLTLIKSIPENVTYECLIDAIGAINMVIQSAERRSNGDQIFRQSTKNKLLETVKK